ncbi:MAG: TonB-dependent receptor [Candidatus Latescibacterota bacterium]
MAMQRSRVPVLLLAALALRLGLHAGPASAQGRDSAAVVTLDSLLSIPISAAARYAQSTAEAPAAAVVVTSDDIRSFGYRTLAEVLASLPGFYLTYDRNYHYVGVRGFSRPTDYNNRILLLIDGHAVNESVFGSAPLGTDFGVPLEAVEYIEVVRGPGSALYGTNAMLAVVNVVTRSGRALNGARVHGASGSFGTRQVSGILGGERNRNLDVAVSLDWRRADGQELYFREFDDPATGDGVAQGLDWDRRYGLLGRARFRGATLLAGTYRRKKAIPTASWETVFGADSRTVDGLTFAELGAERALGATKRLTVRAYVDGYRYSGLYTYEEAEGGTYVDSSWSTWGGAEARLQWDPIPPNRLQVGGEYRHHFEARYLALDEQGLVFDRDFPFEQFSVFAQDEYQATERLALTAGVRVDHYTDAGTSVTPRAAIVYHPSGTGTLKLLYGEAYRRPTPWEAAYAEPGVFKANPELGAETIRTAEVACEQRLGRAVLARASAFAYRIRDLIEETVDPADSLRLYVNRERVEARGVEAEVSGRLPSGASGHLSYTYQRATNRETDAALSNSPRHLVRGGAVLPLPTTRPVACSGAASRWRVSRSASSGSTSGTVRSCAPG